MEPTLLDGDCILVWMAGGQGPERGDLVAIRARDKEGKHLIKRVIAKGGDTVQIDFEGGLVFVNGQRLEEPYLTETTHLEGDVQFPVTVPPDCFFVLGDNRNASEDSRNADIGNVRRRDIYGQAWFVRYPWNNFGMIP